METAGRQFERLLLALEDLVAQEELVLRGDEFGPLASLQERAAALVQGLVTLAEAATPELRQRVSLLIARRSDSETHLQARLGQLREEFSAMQSSRQRIAQVRPVYRQALESVDEGRLCARG